MLNKPKVVFPFVEAGLGHIMPMKAIADTFEKKYGDRTEVIRVDFFKDTNNKKLIDTEKEFVKEVKLHNKYKIRGIFQFFMLNLAGSKLGLKYLMEKRYKKAFMDSIDYIKKLDADIIFNTHFSTLFYSCEAKKRKLINSKVIAYCPDPIIGKQWDNRLDLIGVSSELGVKKAIKSCRFKDTQLLKLPFLIREEVKNMKEGRKYYRKKLNLPEDNFTVLLADGAYGAGKLKETVYKLLKSKNKMTIVAVCGKNEKLYNEFLKICAPSNITFVTYGFTDKMLMLAASCDLFVGKAGASNLAEPIYFLAPTIVTFRATPIEKWICAHYEKNNCAVREENINKAVKLIDSWIEKPELMDKYIKSCEKQHRSDGSEIMADKIWQVLNSPSTVSEKIKIFQLLSPKYLYKLIKSR
jgi:processive 1,2-diacylglycerol beta-glucosyltransferase